MIQALKVRSLWSKPEDSPMTLLVVNFRANFQRELPDRGAKWEWVGKNCNFQPTTRSPYLILSARWEMSRLLWLTIRLQLHTSFRLVRKMIIDLGWPWTPRYALYYRKGAFFWAQSKRLNRHRPALSAAKMSASDSSFWQYNFFCRYSKAFLRELTSYWSAGWLRSAANL